MIDFQREEAGLTAAVGLGSDGILAELGPSAGSALRGVRARYETLASSEALVSAARLERDRLDSLLLELYCPGGLFSRAGALITLRERVRRLSALALSCPANSELTVRLQRESLILRTFAHEQLARRLGASGAAIASSVSGLTGTLSHLHGFCVEAERVDHQVGHHRTNRLLHGAAHALDDFPEKRSVGDAIAFTLHQLAERSEVRSALGQYDALCSAQAASLRDELWRAAEAGFARRATPASLRELTELDLVLEALKAKLTDKQLDGAQRCTAIIELYSLSASARADEAAREAQAALTPLLEVIGSGIGAEARG